MCNFICTSQNTSERNGSWFRRELTSIDKLEKFCCSPTHCNLFIWQISAIVAPLDERNKIAIANARARFIGCCEGFNKRGSPLDQWIDSPWWHSLLLGPCSYPPVKEMSPPLYLTVHSVMINLSNCGYYYSGDNGQFGDFINSHASSSSSPSGL